MTKGQRAMAVATIYPDTNPGKKKTSSETEEVGGVSQAILSRARSVLQYAPDLSANVLTGSASLDDAESSRAKAGVWGPAELAEHLKEEAAHPPRGWSCEWAARNTAVGQESFTVFPAVKCKR